MKECDPEDLKDNVLEILEDIDQKPVLVDVMRFGQPGPKPRPVKVVCESSATVRSILKGLTCETHTGERPYLCNAHWRETLPLKCTLERGLTCEMHTGERPYL